MAASVTYALEGQCYVLHSTALTSQAMFDKLCDTPDKAHLLNPRSGKPGGGFSMVIGPDGRPMAEALAEDEEGLVIAELSLPMISVAKAAADPVGHYSRPDVVRLMLNRKPTPRVMAFEEAPDAMVPEVQQEGTEARPNTTTSTPMPRNPCTGPMTPSGSLVSYSPRMSPIISRRIITPSSRATTISFCRRSMPTGCRP